MHSDRWTYRDAGAMLRFYRQAFAATSAGKTIRLSWAGRDYDAEGWRRQFRLALDRRINLKVGPEPAWRKLGEIYQTELRRDVQRIRDHITKRVIIHQIMTPELRRRFGHLVDDRAD